MKHFVKRGETIQLNWTLHSISGDEFSLSGHSYKLLFSTGNQSAQATGVTHSGNVLSWTFTPGSQWKLGSYSLWLEVYNNGTKIVTVSYPDAFHLVSESFFNQIESDEEETADTTQTAVQTEETTLNLVSSCDFYRFAPVIPVLGDDGYWYVNGVKAVDGNGEPIYASHTVDYDSDTGNIIIDQGRVDSEGNSIEIVITSLATALGVAATDHTTAAADHTTAAADHNTATSDHNTAAADHNTATSDHNTAAADHNTATSDHNTAAADHAASQSATTRANTAAAEAELMVDIKTGPDGKSAYQLALENGFEGTIEQWFISLTGPQGAPGVNNTIMRIVTALPANASQDTLDKVFLIYNSTSEEYDRYYTAFDGTTYSFVQMGSMAIDLDDYVRKDSEVWLTQEQFDALTVKDSTKTYNIYEVDDEIEVEEPEEESEET